MSIPTTDTEGESGVKGTAYVTIPQWILNAEVSDRAVRLFGILSQYVGANESAWPSRRTLASRLACSIATLDRALAELTRLGAVEIERRHREDGSLTSSMYWIWPRLPQDCPDLALPVGGGVAAPVIQHEVTTDRSNYKEDSLLSIEDAQPEATHLATVLADLIEANGSKRPNVTKSWVTEIDRMLRLDGRDPVKAERLMRWCQADEFWRSNILSAAKFRAKYDAMRLRANAEAKKAGEQPVDESHRERRGAQPPPVDDVLAAQEKARAEAVPMPAHLRDWKRQRGHR